MYCSCATVIVEAPHERIVIGQAINVLNHVVMQRWGQESRHSEQSVLLEEQTHALIYRTYTGTCSVYWALRTAYQRVFVCSHFLAPEMFDLEGTI